MERRVAAICKSHIIENEKFRFRPEECGVGNAGAFQVSLCFFGDAARVAIVRFARDRIDDRANQTQRRFGVEDVDPRRRRIRNDEHVRGINHAPAADARTVKPEAVGKNFFVVFGERGGEMLPGAEQSVNLKSINFTSWSLIILLTSDGVLSLAMFRSV